MTAKSIAKVFNDNVKLYIALVQSVLRTDIDSNLI